MIDVDTVSARLRVDGDAHHLVHHVAGVELAPRYEPFLIAAVPIAMRASSSLSVPEPVSPRLLDALPTAQRMLSAWVDDLRAVDVDAQRGVPEATEGRGTAAFFSLGVDSFYTAVRRIDEIDSLVFVHGFDTSPDDARVRDAMSRAVGEAAAELGRPLVEVRTNLRAVSDRFCCWGMYHGAFLGSVAQLLAPSFDRVFLPATFSYRDLIPRGSHVMLDPLWSTEAVEVVHEGLATRVEKLERLRDSDVAMRRLRACWDERGGRNCGQCGKCVRTMASLEIAGALRRCQTFPDRVPLRALARTHMRTELAMTLVRENLVAAQQRPADPRLRWVLLSMIWRGALYRTLKPRSSALIARVWGWAGRLDRWLRRRRN